MKILSVILVSLAIPCEAFQFMSNWKLPTHDPNQEKTQEKFGDKSKLIFDRGPMASLSYRMEDYI